MIRAKATAKKQHLRLKRKRKVRDRISGSSTIPRLSIFKSNKYLYLQAIDDETNRTLCGADSRQLKIGVNKQSATQLGESMAKALQEQKITQVVFDRNGYKYHGVVAALADAIRANKIRI